MNHLKYTDGYHLANRQLKNGTFISARSTYADLKEKDVIWFDSNLQWESILKSINDFRNKNNI